MEPARVRALQAEWVHSFDHLRTQLAETDNRECKFDLVDRWAGWWERRLG
jgi:hypothetical protein